MPEGTIIINVRELLEKLRARQELNWAEKLVIRQLERKYGTIPGKYWEE